jgi:hypothetical protein
MGMLDLERAEAGESLDLRSIGPHNPAAVIAA